METKRHYISVPAPVIRKLDAILSVHLKRAHEYLRACHSFIQFIDDEPMENEEVRFHSPKDLLWLNPARLRVVVLFPKRGLTRYVAERDRPAFWPHSETAECYEPANPDVTSEIAGPIHFHNRVAGVVLFDRIEPEPRFGKTEIAYLETLLERIDAEIRDHEKDVRDALSRIAEKSCEETKSTRGYIAVRQWGGVLEYFYAGKDWERFLKLSVGEGFAGKVFRSNDVELPGHEVLDEQSYIISDESIQSQIAGPISDGDDVIGVINLESFQRHAYNEETKERVRAYALEAKEWAMRYRELDDDLGNASAALLESCTTVIDSFRDQGSAANRRAEESVRALLRGQVLRLPMAGECGFWMGEKSLRPGILPEGIQWERVEREADCAGGNTPAIWIVWAPLFVEGRIDSVCLVEVPASHASSFVLALKALCAIASGAMRQLRSRYRIKLYHELTYFLIENPDTEAGLQRTVRDVKEIFESDHCTLFVRMGEVFVPTLSTAEKLNVQGAPYGYRAAEGAGLTGLVALTKRAICIRDVEDGEELIELGEDLKLRQAPRWKSRVSEDQNARARSLLAVPIFDASTCGQKVNGILRTHRISTNRRPGFSRDNENSLNIIAHLLERPVAAYLRLENQFRRSAPASA